MRTGSYVLVLSFHSYLSISLYSQVTSSLHSLVRVSHPLIRSNCNNVYPSYVFRRHVWNLARGNTFPCSPIALAYYSVCHSVSLYTTMAASLWTLHSACAYVGHGIITCVAPRVVVERWSIRAYSRFAPSQWETALLCNDVFHWLGASLESALSIIQPQKRDNNHNNYVLFLSCYDMPYFIMPRTITKLPCNNGRWST